MGIFFGFSEGKANSIHGLTKTYLGLAQKDLQATAPALAHATPALLSTTYLSQNHHSWVFGVSSAGF